MTALETPDFRRDRWGRPLVTDPTGGTKDLAYGRPSSFGKCIEDDYNLQLWAKRKVLEGLVKDHAIYATACALTFDDKSKEAKAAVNKVVESALAAVRTDGRAELGTALHKMTERLDRGETLDLPPVFKSDVNAYRAALAQAGLTVVAGMIEVHCVCDEMELAGSFDRIVEDEDGNRYIADLKTGTSVDYPHGYAVQLAVYSRSELYDVATGQRSPMPERLDADRGVIIHLPAGEGSCSVHWIDLAKGWEAAKVAAWVKRDWQKDKSLLSPVVRIAPAPPATLNQELRDRIAALTDQQRSDLKARWPKGVTLNKTLMGHLRDVVSILISDYEPSATVVTPPDEGREADPAAIAALRAHGATLPPGAAQWITRTIHGCELAGASIKTKELPSLRRFELCRALLKLAENDQTDRLEDMVRATLGDIPRDTVALLASMGADEATLFARHVDALVLDLADDTPRLMPVA